MYNLTSINAVQFQNLLNAIGQSGGGTDITEQLEAINTTLQNLQIQFSALAENVSLTPIEGLESTNVQNAISELNSSLSSKIEVITTNWIDVNASSYGASVNFDDYVPTGKTAIGLIPIWNVAYDTTQLLNMFLYDTTRLIVVTRGQYQTQVRGVLLLI